MGCIRVVGGGPLYGRLRIQGSKNAALPMLAAAVLHKGRTVLHNCPHIADVEYMVEILKKLGADARWEDHSLYLDCTHLSYSVIPRIYAEKMRSSIIFMGPLLGVMGRCSLAQPGGCVIGKRPIDMHLEALEILGARIYEREGMLFAVAQQLRGGTIEFPKTSVGATQQAILAGVKAKGTTELINCAKEPEIVYLADFLNRRGADVQGAGGSRILIHGVHHLHDIEYEVPPDRIVAGTYLCASAITRGYVTLENVPVEELESFWDIYCKMGGQYEGNSGKLIADSRGIGKNIPYMQTECYPGFPTDLQSPLMAVLATARGVSQIRETIFEDRLQIAEELQKMGALISIEQGTAKITGVHKLRGAAVKARELRGGAALILAGLAAQGETIIENSEYVHRGYEHICEDLTALGGNIKEM